MPDDKQPYKKPRGNKKASSGDLVAVQERKEGVPFVNRGTGLEKDICIPFFQDVIDGIQVHLMIISARCVRGDTGCLVSFERRDIEVGSVTGEQMIAAECLF